ncbi:MAG: ATP-binding protein [Chloroflexota bacterium]
MSGTVVIVISASYIALLFAIAYAADIRRERGRSWITNPYVYSLSLAVYCTAWTFYGSVGRAADSGLGFLPVYLGPTLIALTWWSLLRKIVRISKQQNLTSIADFISARYGNSKALGVLVSIAVVVGIMPYTALQLKAVASTFRIIQGQGALETPLAGFDTAFLVAAFMSVFGILFGARHISPSERHEAMVAAVAFESIVKLVSFLAVGLFVCFWVYDGVDDLFATAQLVPAFRDLFVLNGNNSVDFASWFSITVLSAAAVMFLPRQFHIAVVENTHERHIRTAMWLFPLYLLLINLMVAPIAFAGLIAFGHRPLESDFFVISIPLHYGQGALALLAFIGGLSAATAMLVVESVAVSTVIVNHLVVPVLVKLGGGRDVSGWLLVARRAGIVAVIMLGYVYYRAAGETNTLVNLGLVSFAAAFQFAPALVFGLYFRWASRRGALIGLSAGLGVWAYTLVVPTLGGASALDHLDLSAGPFGIAALKPGSLFGLEGLDPWTHVLFWSLVFNVGGLVAGSAFLRSRSDELAQADGFVNCFRVPIRPAAGVAAVAADVRADLATLMSRFIGTDRANAILVEFARQKGLRSSEDRIPWIHHRDLMAVVERELAGALGPVAARFILDSYVAQRHPRLETIIDAFGEVSLSLEQSREDLARRIRALSILYETSRRVSSSLSFAQVSRATCSLLADELHLDGVEVLVSDGNRGFRALDGPPWLGSESDVEIARLAIDDGRVVTSQDGPASQAPRQSSFRSYLAAPITSGESAFGVLFAYSSSRLVYFSPDLVELSQAVANQLGTAANNAALYDELRALSQDLDQKVQDRTAELERANTRLRETDELKSEFLSVVAHELRTPLTSICSFSEILLSYDVPDPERARSFVKIINDEGVRLSRLIAQLLDLSRIESGRLDLAIDACDPAEIVDSALTVTAPITRRAEVQVTSALNERLPAIRGDRDRLIQVLTNLVTNAVHASPSGDRVVVEANRQNGTVTFSVVDRGPGVRPEDAGLVFEKFTRLPRESGVRTEGTGLGLYVARQIVEHHGGHIWVQRTPGGGATFSFSIPLAQHP